MTKKTSVKELEQKIGELTEALQRERADAMNVRRRADEERIQLGNTIKAMVIEELLPALDHLELAVKHIPKEMADHDYIKGIKSVLKQFDQCFAQLGVERIKTVGEVFDPKLHEAVSVDAPSTAKAKEGRNNQEIVSEELQPGYKIGDDVIRHAKVKVKMQKSKEIR